MLASCAESGLKHFGCKLEAVCLGCISRNWHTSCERDHVGIRDPIRRRDDVLIARVDGTQQGREDRDLRSAADNDLSRSEFQVVLPAQFSYDSCLEFSTAVRGCVFREVAIDGRDARDLDGVGSIKIGLPRLNAMMSRPCLWSSAARLFIARVGEGLMVSARWDSRLAIMS